MSSDYSEDSSDASNKYAQIVVPDYDLANPITTSANKGTTTGSSFLRLGSFPSLTDSTAQPSGFTHSLTLAQLVGGTATSYPSTTAALASNLAEGADAAPPSRAESNEYAGDAHYLLGFADDTRHRGADSDLTPSTTFIDWVGVSNTVAHRQAETNRLLFKGGWWDHADGNRITTTSGDKVEVIQGNYKMVVLGRQDPSTTDLKTLASNAYVADCSGGQVVTQDAGPSPNVMSVEWREEDDAWVMYQDNVVSGNVATRSYGKQATYFKGTEMYTEVGQNPGKFDGSLSHGTGDHDPVITNYTWAKRIETYFGANGKPVNDYYYWIHAYAINNVQTAIEITNTYFATTWELTIGSKTSMVIGPSTEIVVGPKLDVGISKLQFFNFKSVVAAEELKANLLDTRISAAESRISGESDRITASYNVLCATERALKTSIQEVATNVTKVTASTTKIQGQVDDMSLELTIMSALTSIV